MMSDINGLELKICTKCGDQKSLDEFCFADKTKQRRHRQCNHCRNLLKKEWRSKNPDKLKVSNQRNHLKHRDKNLAKQKEYSIKNKERIDAYQAQYYRDDNNKSRAKRVKATYYQANKKALWAKTYARIQKNPTLKLRRRVSISIRNMLVSHGTTKK